MCSTHTRRFLQYGLLSASRSTLHPTTCKAAELQHQNPQRVEALGSAQYWLGGATYRQLLSWMSKGCSVITFFQVRLRATQHKHPIPIVASTAYAYPAEPVCSALVGGQRGWRATDPAGCLICQGLLVFHIVV